MKAYKNDTENLSILNVVLYIINNTHCKYSLPLSNMFTDSLCLIFILCWSTEKIIVGPSSAEFEEIVELHHYPNPPMCLCFTS